MQVLATELRVGGFDLKQVKREGKWAVYEQSKLGKVVAYELVKIGVAPSQRIMGRDYPEREVYPNSEQWGVEGQTIMGLDDALGRLSQLTCKVA